MDTDTILIRGRRIARGYAEGLALIAPVWLSFWGGFDPATGIIIEKGNPLQGESVDGRILIFKSTKGSSGTSGAIGIAKHMGHKPAAFVTTQVDALAALACVIHDIPMISELERDPFQLVQTGDWIKLDADKGFMEITNRT